MNICYQNLKRRFLACLDTKFEVTSLRNYLKMNLSTTEISFFLSPKLDI